MYASIALPIPTTGCFDYIIPESIKNSVHVGSRIMVPFRGRNITGYVLELKDHSDQESLKEIDSVLDSYPLFPEDMVSFFKWISSYYQFPIGKVIQTALPPGLNARTRVTIKLKILPEKIPSLSLSEDEKRILKYLSLQGEITLYKLRKNIKDLPLKKLISSLERKGVLEIKRKIIPPSIKEKKESFVKLIHTNIDIKRIRPDKKPHQILMWLKDKKFVSVQDIYREFGMVKNALNRLASLGYITITRKRVLRNLLYDDILNPYEKPENLTDEQKKVIKAIYAAINEARFERFLLYGVTGSGKTEIYIRATEETLKKGKNIIILLPEIALATSIESIFRNRFGEKVGVIHSGLKPGEILDQWWQILHGNYKIVIGTRSALFAPFENIGLIVVDEEHDPSFKQEEGLTYNARDAAIVRARMNGAVCILGSATPSVVSWYNAQKGKYKLIELKQRINRLPLPKIEIVDLREIKPHQSPGLLSPKLITEIKETIDKGNQALLFLNRRGFSNRIICLSCGWIPKCIQCDISLSYHKSESLISCHYCGYRKKLPPVCPKCGFSKLLPSGVGTEKLLDILSKIFPKVSIGRMDRDTIKDRKDLLETLRAIKEGRLKIVVGTQMIAKGHHFPNITLVGIICADLSLYFPEYLSSERTFQLITQVCGRSGRGEDSGKVIIQTFNPDHYVLKLASEGRIRDFYEEELRRRAKLLYPPISRLAKIVFGGKVKEETIFYAKEITETARKIVKEMGLDIKILGPSESPISRLRGLYRWQVLIKGNSHKTIKNLFKDLNNIIEKRKRNIRIIVDIDPISFM